MLINRNHTYTDLYLPIDARQERLRTPSTAAHDRGDLRRGRAKPRADFFRRLWLWDQVVFDMSLR